MSHIQLVEFIGVYDVEFVESVLFEYLETDFP